MEGCWSSLRLLLTIYIIWFKPVEGGLIEESCLGGEYSHVTKSLTGTHVYVGTRCGLHVIDVTGDPIMVSKYDISFDKNVTGIVAVGTDVYLSIDFVVMLIDVSNPSSPNLIASYTTSVSGGIVLSLFMRGSTLYICVGSEGLEIVDWSSRLSPSLLSRFDQPSYDIEDVVVNNNNIAFCSTTDGLKIIDVTIPSAVVNLSTVTFIGSGFSISLSSSLQEVLYASVTSGLHVIDINNPSSPVHLGSFSSAAEYAVHSGGYAYVANGNKLSVLNMSVLGVFLFVVIIEKKKKKKNIKKKKKKKQQLQQRLVAQYYWMMQNT